MAVLLLLFVMGLSFGGGGIGYQLDRTRRTGCHSFKIMLGHHPLDEVVSGGSAFTGVRYLREEHTIVFGINFSFPYSLTIR